MSQAAYIQIHLEAAGQRFDVAQAGPDFIELAGSHLPPAGPAIVETRMDDHVQRDAVHIVGPASGASKRVMRIEPRPVADVA